MLLLKARYGAAPTKTYFFGSLTGGRDGLTVIQRWPADYDGIVVNRPALNYTGLRLSNVVLGRALYLNGGAGWLDVNKTVLLENAVTKACDTLDGVADGIISNVAACKLQAPAVLAALRCPAGKDTRHLPLRCPDRNRERHCFAIAPALSARERRHALRRVQHPRGFRVRGSVHHA